MKNKLDKLLNNAHATYSNVQVAAIAKTKSGDEFVGVNVENSSFGASICAERSAMMSAVSKGTKPGDITEIHLTSSLSKILFPCAMCLQVMTELLSNDATITIYYKDEVVVKTLSDLLPYAVNRESFEWE